MTHKITKIIMGIYFIFLGPILWILGALSGVFAEWLWGDTFRAIMIAMGLTELAAIPLWQTGAFFMFLGGFFARPIPVYFPND